MKCNSFEATTKVARGNTSSKNGANNYQARSITLVFIEKKVPYTALHAHLEMPDQRDEAKYLYVGASASGKYYRYPGALSWR